jgi:hypothetical protein
MDILPYTARHTEALRRPAGYQYAFIYTPQAGAVYSAA